MNDMTMEAMTGLSMGRKRTHRGRRGRGKGSKENHETAKGHIMAAQESKDPKESRMHLFKALSALKKC